MVTAAPTTVETTTAPTTVPVTTAPATTIPATTAPATTIPVTTSPPGIALTNSCRSDLYGWTVSYPEGWYAATASVGPEQQCANFATTPLETIDDIYMYGELGTPVSLSSTDDDWGSTVAQIQTDAIWTIVSTTDTTVAGAVALRVEWMSSGGESYIPPDQGGVFYLVDRDGPSVVSLGCWMTVNDRSNVAVLDAMAPTLTFG